MDTTVRSRRREEADIVNGRLARAAGPLARRWSLDILGRRLPSPGGRFENSPAVHCRVPMRHPRSPEGTAESSECHESVPIPILVAEIQPSLWNSMSLFDNPTLERVGCSQISLRETPDEQPLLFEERRAEKCPNSRAGPLARRNGKLRPAWACDPIDEWASCPFCSAGRRAAQAGSLCYPALRRHAKIVSPRRAFPVLIPVRCPPKPSSPR